MSTVNIFEVSRRELAAALSRLKATAPASSPKTALRSVRIQFDADALTVELGATDMERVHTERVGVVAEPLGSTTGALSFANCAELAAAVGATKSPTVHVELSAERVYVDGLRLSPPIDGAEYPALCHYFDTPNYVTVGGAIVDAATVRALLALSSPFICADSSRYSLGGVRLEATRGTLGDALRCVATDGRRLANVATPGKSPEQYAEPVDADGRPELIQPVYGLMPIGAARLLERQLTKTANAKTVVFEFLRRVPTPEPEQPENENAAASSPTPPASSSNAFDGVDVIRVATFDGLGNALTIVSTRCIEGRYPNYSQVMPRELTPRGSVRVAELAAVCKRARAVIDQDTRGARLSIRERVAIVRTSNAGGRSVRDALRVAGGSNAGTIRATLDIKFLGELAAAAASAGIDAMPVEWLSSTSPAVFGLGEFGHHVIMPMGRDENLAERRAARCRRIDAENEQRAADELAERERVAAEQSAQPSVELAAA